VAKFRDVTVAVVVLAVFTSPFWLAAYVETTGRIIEGVVTSKHEAIEMPGDDRWQHVFRVAYRYRPTGAAFPKTGEHPVDAALFHRLHAGSRVAVRYTEFPLLSAMQGVGSYLADSTWCSRKSFDGDTWIRLAEGAGVVIAALLGFAAFRARNRPLGWMAALIGGSLASSVLLAGFVVFPVLFLLWCRNRGRGYGSLFLATLSLTAALLYLRIPRPTTLPVGPTREANAIVRRIGVVKRLWADDEGAQGIRDPYQMLDLEYTPAGAAEPIHAMDRIDLNSLPGLSEGASVRIQYSAAEPGAARVLGGTREYPLKTMDYMMALTFGFGAALTLGFGLILFIEGKVRGWYTRLLTRPLPDDAINRVSALPPDDPRRIAVNAFLRAKARQSRSQDNT
jgi:hypothetical protein